ncbi:MAG TPA: zinc ribbon domain-containing protein [Saprospiraceae bacterium]|nr:zinc ribbon domain-containing protein [Saprospiraceae bacterium]HNM25225.1 zinc ribbon domain-containing protein [Saprospiraceae bacterium]
MKGCPNCAAEIIPGAKFCHRCGDKIAEKTKLCPACQETNPYASVFCHHCGFHFEGRQRHDVAYQPMYVLDFHSADLTSQVKALFFRSLRKRVEDEHDIERYSDYVERFYTSAFRTVYDSRSRQIAEDAQLQWQRFGQNALPEIDRRIDHAFEGLLDYFVIQFCPDLNGIILPETILKYDSVSPGKTDLWHMIRDFLDFPRETESFYFDFITMPEALLANACKNYLFADRRERVYFLCDLSLKGNCKEGFAMTDRGIYWRTPYGKAQKALYHQLHELRKEKNWLLINGAFFTVNPSMNLKMCKLLKKLRGWKPVGAHYETT